MPSVDPSSGSPTVAIVGSGPSGCYTAQFLRKKWKNAEIVVIDRLTTPYGLLRYGVAPDHLGTRAVSKQFDRLFEQGGATFVGGVEVGTDVTLDAIRESFDVVVLATGLWADRGLTSMASPAPAEALPGVYGAGTLTRLINGHPDETADTVRIGSRIAIVGQGNVAIDLVRLLLAPRHELLGLGVDSDVVDALQSGPILSIDLIGRSDVESAKFDVAMVRELAKTPDVRFTAPDMGDSLAAGDPARREAVAELVAGSPATATREVRFRFGWTPDALTGSDRVGSIALRGRENPEEVLTLDVDTVCTAIGFTEASTAPLQRIHHEGPRADIATGLLDDGLFCVGWLRRGPQGTIPANRADSKLVADTIANEVDAGISALGKPGWAAVETAILASRLSLPTLI